MSDKFGFENSLLTFDDFSAHKTDEVQEKLIETKKTYFDDSAWLSFKMLRDGRLY